MPPHKLQHQLAPGRSSGHVFLVAFRQPTTYLLDKEHGERPDVDQGIVLGGVLALGQPGAQDLWSYVDCRAAEGGQVL